MLFYLTHYFSILIQPNFIYILSYSSGKNTTYSIFYLRLEKLWTAFTLALFWRRLFLSRAKLVQEKGWYIVFFCLYLTAYTLSLSRVRLWRPPLSWLKFILQRRPPLSWFIFILQRRPPLSWFIFILFFIYLIIT